jgi:hypothetical protein
MNNMVKIALRFRSDLAELIEPNRRRSGATCETERSRDCRPFIQGSN